MKIILAIEDTTEGVNIVASMEHNGTSDNGLQSIAAHLAAHMQMHMKRLQQVGALRVTENGEEARL